MKIIVVNSNPVHLPLEQKCKTLYKSVAINKKDDLSILKLKKLKPDYIFFIHWSYIIPLKIFENFNCILFHMTDLPYGRGGSPLQNLIIRGHKKTRISAIKVSRKIDAGPVYLKRNLSLNGTANEIFVRAGGVMFEMIKEIIKKKPSPAPQKGNPIFFKRRKPIESKMDAIFEIEKVYDFIRMLDAEGYPLAFIETKNMKIEFNNAKVVNNKTLIANARITKR